ncbi:MAG: hypothetical protein K2K34_04110 [Oscillospiraceae bacterium]|nr:hypothetical protein [Oscillospiraceae bacterium]
MKKKLFSVLLMCAVSAMIFSGCRNKYKNEDWTDKIDTYFDGLRSNASGMKNIDRAHREAFDSVFNNIEIFGTSLCVPMKVSDLPDKFELSYSLEYVPLSEEEPNKTELDGGLERYSLQLYYDKEVRVAGVSVICREDQSIEEGIIYKIDFGVFYFQPIFLGGKVDVNSDISDIKEFLGDGNEFYDVIYSESEYCTLFYTDGNRIIELTYSIRGDDINFLLGYVRTYNSYGSV